ncbi:hypothetical protein MLD38_012375 [Melastoma candidum]|uniref:Uncharacterized protein n=1 Tax=Melastoma candidum TaxID=119954 RepID=A0ACB9R5J7_9MYRT|nr:hypothetical protein MLD38_012375 [Melastoma candidum]
MMHGVFIPRLMEKIRASKADADDYSDLDDITKTQISFDKLTREPSWDSQVSSPFSSLTDFAYSATGYEHGENNHNASVEADNWSEFKAQGGNNSWYEGRAILGHSGVERGKPKDVEAAHLVEED